MASFGDHSLTVHKRLWKRGGIITLCFAFGCWAFLGIFSEVTCQMLFDELVTEPRRPLTVVEQIIVGINAVCGLVYFHSSYLAYQASPNWSRCPFSPPLFFIYAEKMVPDLRSEVEYHDPERPR